MLDTYDLSQLVEPLLDVCRITDLDVFRERRICKNIDITLMLHCDISFLLLQPSHDLHKPFIRIRAGVSGRSRLEDHEIPILLPGEHIPLVTELRLCL